MGIFEILCCMDWISPAVGMIDSALHKTQTFAVDERDLHTAKALMKRNGIKLRPGDQFIAPGGEFIFSVAEKDKSRAIGILKRAGLL